MTVVSCDPRIDDYIAARADFARPILAWVRQRHHAACPAVEEPTKWSMPAFSYAGRPLANIAAFKAHATFGVWYRHDLATGKEGEATGQYGRIGSMTGLPDAEAVEAQVRQVTVLIDSGAPPKRAAKAAKAAKAEAAVPDALAEALAHDDAAAATFDGLGAVSRDTGQVLHMRTDPAARFERFDQVLATVKRANVTRLGFVGDAPLADWGRPL
jgi:biopolymer transport protein ExbD